VLAFMFVVIYWSCQTVATCSIFTTATWRKARSTRRSWWWPR